MASKEKERAALAMCVSTVPGFPKASAEEHDPRRLTRWPRIIRAGPRRNKPNQDPHRQAGQYLEASGLVPAGGRLNMPTTSLRRVIAW